MIRYLTFEKVLHNSHNKFFVPVTPSQKETRDKKNKNKEKTKKQTQQPSCSSHLNKGTEDMRKQNTKVQEKKNQKLLDDTQPLSPTCTFLKKVSLNL